MRGRRAGGSTVRALLTMVAAVTLLGASSVAAQQTTITHLRVEKKPGAADGRAMATVTGSATVKGKVVAAERTGRIADHAVQAWSIMHGQGALLLLAPQKKTDLYRLRYYDPDARKGRMLGLLPFARAAIVESNAAGQPWAFAITGIDPHSGQTVTFAGNLEALHARIDGASEPRFADRALWFHTPAGWKQATISRLMGEYVQGLILAPSNTPDGRVKYLQFLSNGTALTFLSNGQMERGHWLSDGATFRIRSRGKPAAVWLKTDLHPVTGILATRRIGVRLLQPLSSRTAKVGMEVKTI